MDQEECKEGTDRCQVGKERDGQESSGGGDEETREGGGDDGGLVLGVELGGELGEETVDGHGEEDTGLTEQEDQHDRDQTGQDTDLTEDGEPALTRGRGDDLEGSVTDTLAGNHGVVDDAQHDDRGGDVEDCAEDQTEADTDGKITLGVTGLLGCSRDGVETDKGKEDNRRSTKDTRSTKLTKGTLVWGDERVIVHLLDRLAGAKDKDKDDKDFDDDQDVVDTSRGLDTSAEDESQEKDNHERWNREPGAGQFENVVLVGEGCFHQFLLAVVTKGIIEERFEVMCETDRDRSCSNQVLKNAIVYKESTKGDTRA